MDGADPPRLTLLRSELILERGNGPPDSSHLARERDRLKRERVDRVPRFLVRGVYTQALEMKCGKHFLRLRLLRAPVRAECVAVWARGVRLGDVCLGAVGRRVVAVELMWQGQRSAVSGERERNFDAVDWD